MEPEESKKEEIVQPAPQKEEHSVEPIKSRISPKLLYVLIGIGVVVLLCIVLAMAGRSKTETNYTDSSAQDSLGSTTTEYSSPAAASSNPKKTEATRMWSFSGSEWEATGTPASCPDPLVIPTPVDISHATAILYPGQYRGGDYKPHGGFIFGNSENDAITVTVPLDAVVHKASRYIEQGETQYMFVFIAPCGIMYHFDHLLTLSPDFQKLADQLPAAQVDDSRTTEYNPPVAVKAGDVVATAVGFKNSNNTSVDFGVYDLRHLNQVSKTAAWQKEHPDENEYGKYAICWLNLLTSPDDATALALPGGDGQAGKTSDYCN